MSALFRARIYHLKSCKLTDLFDVYDTFELYRNIMELLNNIFELSQLDVWFFKGVCKVKIFLSLFSSISLRLFRQSSLPHSHFFEQ